MPRPIWRQSRQSAIAMLVLSIAIGLVACGPLGARAGSSVRTENPWLAIDFVVRDTSDGSVAYVALAAGTSGLVRQSDRRPQETTIAVLDPVSCRVISEIALGADAHVFVGVDTAGQVSASPYDPTDYGQWPDIGNRLLVSPRCANADPRSTAAPTPGLVGGIRLEPGAIDCEVAAGSNGNSDPSKSPFNARVEFSVGAVAGCEAHDHDGRSTTEAGITVLNPSDDRHRLAVAWNGTSCTIGATVTLIPTLAGNRVHVISIDDPCAEKAPESFSVVLSVVDAIDATKVSADIERIEDPGPP
jgi:hypothetical protein